MHKNALHEAFNSETHKHQIDRPDVGVLEIIDDTLVSRAFFGLNHVPRKEGADTVSHYSEPASILEPPLGQTGLNLKQQTVRSVREIALCRPAPEFAP